MSISGPTPDQPSYRSDFKESVNLFEKSFQGMQQSELNVQKDKYVQVMHQSLNAMQESASAMVNQKLSDLKNTLSKDLNSYIENPNDQNREKVESDIQQIKNEEDQ